MNDRNPYQPPESDELLARPLPVFSSYLGFLLRTILVGIGIGIFLMVVFSGRPPQLWMSLASGCGGGIGGLLFGLLIIANYREKRLELRQ